MQHTCNTHATRHATRALFLRILNENAPRMRKFGITTLKEELGRQASKRALWIENSQEKCSCCMSCCMCVACAVACPVADGRGRKLLIRGKILRASSDCARKQGTHCLCRLCQQSGYVLHCGFFGHGQQLQG